MSMSATAIPHTPRTLRVLCGLSQERLALRAGKSVRTIAAVESGGRVTYDTLASYARAVGVTTSVLVQAFENLTAPALALMGA